jgi:hypothetical protein
MKFVLSVLHRSADAGSTVRQVGEYERVEDAIAGAKQVVNDVLGRLHVAGMTSAQLQAQYREAAEAPYIIRDDEETMNASSFNHFQYAKTRSDELCGESK